MSTHPPKPIWAPHAVDLSAAATTDTALPADVMASWRGFWHAVGSSIPFYVNHSRANRKALRRAVGRRG